MSCALCIPANLHHRLADQSRSDTPVGPLLASSAEPSVFCATSLPAPAAESAAPVPALAVQALSRAAAVTLGTDRILFKCGKNLDKGTPLPQFTATCPPYPLTNAPDDSSRLHSFKFPLPVRPINLAPVSLGRYRCTTPLPIALFSVNSTGSE